MSCCRPPPSASRRRLVCTHGALGDDRRAQSGLCPHRPRQGPVVARIVFRHALPNAILPIIAMIGIDIGQFMGGVVVVEAVYGWPGIGQLAWQAIQQVDIPIIMGVTLVSALAIVIGNLLADLIAPLIDPRIRTR
jgi:ABC-type dipeptide/oligopeptide/nickel transport system permease component